MLIEIDVPARVFNALRLKGVAGQSATTVQMLLT